MHRTISLTTLVVPCYDAGIAFYVGAVGFTLVEDVDQGEWRRWVVVSPAPDDPCACGLLLARAHGERQRASIGNQTGGRVGLFLRTDDFARDFAAMRAAGVVFEEEPRGEPYGTVAVWRDPWGNRWDLIGPATADAEGAGSEDPAP